MANLVAWAAAILTLVFLTPLFTNLPQTTPAALILACSLCTLLRHESCTPPGPVSRPEFALGVLTFAGVIFVGVLQGMLLGLVGSLLILILRSSRAHVSQLGKVPDEDGAYSDVIRHPENVLLPGVVILRLNSPIYYANALTVRDRMTDLIKASEPPVTAVLFDAVVQEALDITSSDMLSSFVKRLREAGQLETYFAEVQDPVLEFSEKTGLLDVSRRRSSVLDRGCGRPPH